MIYLSVSPSLSRAFVPLDRLSAAITHFLSPTPRTAVFCADCRRLPFAFV